MDFRIKSLFLARNKKPENLLAAWLHWRVRGPSWAQVFNTAHAACPPRAGPGQGAEPTRGAGPGGGQGLRAPRLVPELPVERQLPIGPQPGGAGLKLRCVPAACGASGAVLSERAAGGLSVR